jgi:ADP-heptose:LPS heptosyltransferase
VVLLGAQTDSQLLEDLGRRIGAVAVTALAWPIRELLALIEGARIFLGNDSGPAHAAAALGVPTAVIFGSSSSTLWGPWRADSAEVVQNHFDCNPCAGDTCHAFGEPRCILSIEASQVRSAVEGLLSTRQPFRAAHAPSGNL